MTTRVLRHEIPVDRVGIIWDGPVIDMHDQERVRALSRAQGRELGEFVERCTGVHEGALTVIARVEYEVVDCPLIKVTRLATEHDDRGRQFAIPDPDDPMQTLRLSPTEHAIVGELPAWWRP